MQKDYLLLRNEQQEGPFSLEDMKTMNLLATDLVCTAGTGFWQFPWEIEPLKPFVALPDFLQTTTGQTDTKKAEDKPAAPRVFVSMPMFTTPPAAAQPVMEQEPVIQAPVVESVPVAIQQVAAPHPVQQTAEEYIKQVTSIPERKTIRTLAENDHIVPEKKQQAVAASSSFAYKKLFGTALLIIAAVTGFFFWQKQQNKKEIQPVALVQEQAVNESTSAPVDEPQQSEPGSVTETKVASLTPQKTITNKTVPAKAKPATSKKISPAEPGNIEEKTPVQQSPIAEDKKTPVATTAKKEEASPEKKKGIAGLFQKVSDKLKVKKPAAEQKTQVPEESPEPRADRSSAHRDEDAKPDMSAIAGQIILSTSGDDNWMMGISKMMVTLNNRSAVALKSAAAVVSYYNENNDLLEKKTLNFSNIGAKLKVSMKAPDNKFADHVSVELGEITAKEDGYALK